MGRRIQASFTPSEAEVGELKRLAEEASHVSRLSLLNSPAIAALLRRDEIVQDWLDRGMSRVSIARAIGAPKGTVTTWMDAGERKRRREFILELREALPPAGDDESVVDRLRRRRLELGETGVRIAEQLGINDRQFYLLETGVHVPRLDFLHAWAAVLGLCLSVSDSEPEPPHSARRTQVRLASFSRPEMLWVSVDLAAVPSGNVGSGR